MQVGPYNKTTLGNIDNKKAAVVAKSEPGLRVQEFQGGRGLNIGALRIGRGFWGVYSTTNIIKKNPRNSIGTYLGPYTKYKAIRARDLVEEMSLGFRVERRVDMEVHG